jgi:MoaA/NifB/PqqE/SkfB family radical SAM enzyme
MADRVKAEVDPYVVEVSLHGATAEVHDRQTRVPGSFERLLANLKGAGEAGLRLGVITTPTAWNGHQIEDMIALCDGLGIPIRFRGPVGPRDNGHIAPLAIHPTAATWERVTEQVVRRRAQREAEQGSVGAPAVVTERAPEVQATWSAGVACNDSIPQYRRTCCLPTRCLPIVGARTPKDTYHLPMRREQVWTQVWVKTSSAPAAPVRPSPTAYWPVRRRESRPESKSGHY